MLHTIESVTAMAAIAAVMRLSFVAFIFFLPVSLVAFWCRGAVCAIALGRAVRNFARAREFTMPQVQTAVLHTRAVTFRTRGHQRSARRFLSEFRAVDPASRGSTMEA